MNFDKSCFDCRNMPAAMGVVPIGAYHCEDYKDGYIKYDCPHWTSQFYDFEDLEKIKESKDE